MLVWYLQYVISDLLKTLYVLYEKIVYYINSSK